MPTILESLTSAADALKTCLAQWQALYNSVAAKQTETVTNVTNIINTFVSRPAVATIFCDPVSGNDANDGSTIAKAKKTIDAIALGMTGPQGVTVLLLADAVVRLKTSVAGRLAILGVQRANNAFGYIYYNRTITFLGTAENSPIPDPNFTITTGAGFFANGGNYSSDYISYALQDQPAGQSYSEHITVSAGSLSITNGTLTVGSAAAGSLIGAAGGRLTATVSLTLGAGAAGHLFKGVAAGANPNAQFVYSTNVTSA